MKHSSKEAILVPRPPINHGNYLTCTGLPYHKLHHTFTDLLTHLQSQIIHTVGGYETRPHTKIFTETLIATDETEKYTDVRVIVPQLSGVAAAGTGNRMDKVHTLQLEGYRKFDFMLFRPHATLCGECSYYVNTTRYHRTRIMQDFALFVYL